MIIKLECVVVKSEAAGTIYYKHAISFDLR